MRAEVGHVKKAMSYRHDDLYGTLMPVTQGGFADQYIDEHKPWVPATCVVRGVYWQSTFEEQRLTFPEVLSPEQHVHLPP